MFRNIIYLELAIMWGFCFATIVTLSRACMILTCLFMLAVLITDLIRKVYHG